MYRFELETVLDFRKHYEKKVQSELIECEKLFRIENARLKEYDDKRKEIIGTFENKMKNGIMNMECRLFLSYIESINANLIDQSKKVAALQAALDDRKKELIRAIQHRKIIEKLKEKRLNVLLYEENRKQTQILDEFSSNKKYLEMEKK